ncbi:hypothetical protein NCCP2716_12970 [Sporosarcina sp. NCCP-2716]|uniref:GGDEF domain-containing protein n=1 Tax=Sporosarcina sp. NCCP-2716 TaxID=2943679 RepID=UPI00203EE489|nr:GGDEF domain-containing protein [Sporosarcina sp. NCCP-2716]GKV68799.1 hypothetical protein NCCP2716_12970 [Sporosarcina sp. NCCP-2716]
MAEIRSKKWAASLLWVLFVPAAFYAVFMRFPFAEANVWFLAVNFVMLIITMNISFTLKSISISIERWIVFVIFFQHGLFAEMIFMQAAILMIQIFKTSSLPPVYRFTTNSLMFLVVSVCSAVAFYAVGGQIGGEMSPWAFTGAAIVYALTYSLGNTLVLYIILKLEKAPTDAMKTVGLWDLTMTLVYIPLAIAYSLLADQLETFAVLLFGMPFLLILFIIRRYAFSGEFHDKLTSAVEIGHELTESLRTDEVIEIFIEKIKGVANYDQLYLLDVHHEKELALMKCSEAGLIAREAQYFSYEPEAFLRMEISKTVICGSPKEMASLSYFTFSPAVQSLMMTPVIRNGRTEGFLLMTSFRRNFFEDLDTRMVELLAGYFETSIVKAFHYENTIAQSEKCGLTKLHNFRYLTKQLSREMERLRADDVQVLSAIIMDIDHFKSINDTYGHQSGNDILIAFADILRNYETNDRTLARYGGEEFVLLLPGHSKEEAVELAERIRQRVEESVFRIVPDLSADRGPVSIHLTVSLGVSSIPEDTESETSLLRNADRALYIGGKQAGRNRVGIYENDKTKPIEI